MSAIDGLANPTLAGPGAAAVLECQAALLAHARLDVAAAQYATSLAGLFGLERVSIGLLEGGATRLLALSHGASLDPRQQFNARLTAAMDEAIDQRAIVAWPADDAAQPRIALAHAALLRADGGAVCTIPFTDPATGALAGAFIFERLAGLPFDDAEIHNCDAAVRAGAPLLLLKRQAERPWWRRALTDGRARFTGVFGAGKLRQGLTVAALAALAALLLTPFSYQVGAPVRLEGEIQRAVVAGDDGFIQQVMVRPGDAVKAGQVMAELAQQDLQLQRSKLDSELSLQEVAAGMALAQSDRSQLIASQARAEQARAQLDLIGRQIERALIRAPFDGVVISGDLTQSLGSPVQRGGLLMVVAPQDRYRLIVEVDERDIGDIDAGAAGRLTLAAAPDQALPFHVVRVAPVAVTRDGRHFFEVEGRLDQAGGALRPGLAGVARIEAPARSLLSSWGRRTWIWLRLSLWSLGWWQ